MGDETKKVPECFVIMPFTTPEGYESDHFKKIYNQLFKPAIKAAGYEPHRVDEDNASNTIQSKIIERLIDAPMVLCDLSTRNPNVLYELGMRHAFDKPVLLVQEKSTPRIFDISGISTVDYRGTRLYDEILEDQELITKALKETASVKKKYSVLSTYGINAAKIRDAHSMSTDDRISLQLSLITDTMNNIGDRLDRLEQNQMSAIAATNNASVRNYDPADDVQKLIHVVMRTQNLLTHCRSQKSLTNADRMQLYNASMELQRAIFAVRSHPINELGLEKYLAIANDEIETITHMCKKSQSSDTDPNK